MPLCEAESREGQISDCRVIEVLADHSQCKHDEHAPPFGRGQTSAVTGTTRRPKI